YYPNARGSLVDPDIGEVLADEVAGGDAPALQLRRGRDDAVPPQKRNRVGAGPRMPLEGAHDPGPLARVGGHRLGDVKRVEKTVGRAGEIDRRQIVRDVFGQLEGWVVVEIARKIQGDVEVPAVDHLLPIPDVAPVLRRRDAAFLPPHAHAICVGETPFSFRLAAGRWGPA